VGDDRGHVKTTIKKVSCKQRRLHSRQRSSRCLIDAGALSQVGLGRGWGCDPIRAQLTWSATISMKPQAVFRS